MASAPPNGMPLFYNDLQPLSSQLHAKWKAREMQGAPYFANAHAVPLTVEEFAAAQRFHPIVFSAGANPVPLALFGLNEGVNIFVDATGMPTREAYVPAYVRRYPFMLAKLREDSDDLSLCFDASCEVLGEFEDGVPLFEDNGEPAEAIRQTLSFCENFEQAGMRTGQFMQELLQNKLLIDGEVTIEIPGSPQPYTYRGFQIVSEDRLRDLRGDVLRKMTQSGLLPLVYAHLFSLPLIRDVFALQTQQGRTPPPQIIPNA